MGNADQGQVWEIGDGWNVYSADGGKLGSVEEVQPHYLVVGKGFLFHKEHYVPVSAITSVDGENVHLGVSKAEIERQGWDTVPEPGSYQTIETTDARTHARTTDGDTLKVPVREEALDVSKREVERGSVRVHKDVVERQEQIDVPLREETVRVEWHSAADDTRADVGEHAFQEEDIEIPLRGEEVAVSKRTRVREHLHIDKDVREREQPVSGKVRREEVRVEGEDVDEIHRRP
jgi:uncharacterized protein (TIGR02271 family)